MAPEVASDGFADPRSDVYSLAVVLFEAATGRLPYVADTPFQMLHQHLGLSPRQKTIACSHCGVLRPSDCGSIAVTYQPHQTNPRIVFGNERSCGVRAGRGRKA